MRISEQFGLADRHGSLDFVDVPITRDAALFIDPSTLVGRNDDWSMSCVSSIQGYFQAVLTAILANDHSGASALLTHLSEDNSTHLGYSPDSKGSGLGPTLAESFYVALATSEALQSGYIRDIEETALLIPGIAEDRISDVVTNIIRPQLVEYTIRTANYYGIPLTPNGGCGWMWDDRVKSWSFEEFDAPVVNGNFLTLVPKNLVRRGLYANAVDFLNRQVLPYRYSKLIANQSPLIRVFKDGTVDVWRGRARAAFRDATVAESGDADIVKTMNYESTQEEPELLQRYMAAKRGRPPAPVPSRVVAGSVGSPPPNLQELITQVHSVAPGRDEATVYERSIEALLTELLYPALVYPQRQVRLNEGRKVVDITYANHGQDGFFYWAALHYPAATIAVECKNYSGPIGNKELDQLAGRFSPSRGRIGILACRAFADKQKVVRSCRDTSKDDRGFIIPLDDDDLGSLVAEYVARDGDATAIGGLLYARFQDLLK